MCQQLKKSQNHSWLRLPSDFGISLYFYCDKGVVTSVDMKLDSAPKAYIFTDDTFLIDLLVCFLDHYFNAKNKVDLPLFNDVTPFQDSVYKKLMQVEFGKTISYGDLAKRLGRDQAQRAVASACKKNKLPFVIPCHRVVYKNKQIGGFNKGIELKEKLLLFENK